MGSNTQVTPKGKYYNNSVVWNSPMEFPIMNGNESIKFVLMCKDDTLENVVLG